MSNSVIFEGSEATNVTAYFGSTAILSCKIRNNLDDNPVRLLSAASAMVMWQLGSVKYLS